MTFEGVKEASFGGLVAAVLVERGIRKRAGHYTKALGLVFSYAGLWRFGLYASQQHLDQVLP